MDIDEHAALFRALPVDDYQTQQGPDGWAFVLTRDGVPQLRDRGVWPLEALAEVHADNALHLAGQVSAATEERRPYLVRLLWEWVAPL